MEIEKDKKKEEHILENENGETDNKNNVVASNCEENKVVVYYFRFIAISVVLVLTFWFGFNKGKEYNPILNNVKFDVGEKVSNEKQADFSLFWKVWNLLQDKYVDANKLTASDLLYSSIKGMLWATKDPYTVFMDPKEVKEFNSEIDGEFEGIGAEVGIKHGILTIIAPLQNSPAQKAGLRAGDKVLKINGESTAEMSIDEAVSKMRGKKGTDVKLTVFRNDDENKTKEITVTRDVIKVDSVTFEMKNGIPYFKVVRFGEDTANRFKQLSKKIPQDAPGVIIDLRNNPGGYLSAAIEMGDLMIPKGKVIVIEKDKGGKEEKFYSKGYNNILQKKNIIILINQGSASASEILSGALRENRDDVTLVGMKSFGKGSVQEFIDLPGGSATKITVAKWLTPKGEQISGKGIEPDIKVELTNDDYENNRDPQLKKAMELLGVKQ